MSVDERAIHRFRRVALRSARVHGRDFPWRQSRDPYKVLIGEVLLQRTRGEHVAPVFDVFVRRWPGPNELAKARQRSIGAVVRPLGLAKRAPTLKQLGIALVEAGFVPTEPAALRRLPGVGPYAANAVPIFALGQDLPLVDWVIARVLRRFFGLPEGNRPNADPALWRVAESLVRVGRARDLWLGTLDFAARVCKPRPACPECPLREACSFHTEARRGT